MALLSPIEEADLESPIFARPAQLPAFQPPQAPEHTPPSPAEDGVEPPDPTYGLWLDGEFKDIEGPWTYLHGGHHPVFLGDNLGLNSQYRVIHKLGTGGFANVWLCRVLGKEPTQYVAVKVLMARLSGGESREMTNTRRLQELAEIDPLIAKYCLLPLGYYEFDGPNGHHQCFVYPVAGQTVKEIDGVVEGPDEYLRSLSRQAAEAMGALHRHGICHGDFRPSNILLRADWLNGMSEEEVLECFDEPMIAHVIGGVDLPPDASIPHYLVYPLDFWMCRDKKKIASDRICIIDFGEAYESSDPPKEGVGIPFHYAPPELALEQFCFTATDIYALATTMFEMRMGRRLFPVFEQGSEAYLHCLVKHRGPLPEDWWCDWVEAWKDAHAAFAHGPAPELTEGEEIVRRRHIHKETKGRVRHMLNDGWHDPLAEDERVLFEDLLFGMSWNNPPQRMSIEDVLRHPWFSYRPASRAQPGNQPQVTELTQPEAEAHKPEVQKAEFTTPTRQDNENSAEEVTVRLLNALGRAGIINISPEESTSRPVEQPQPASEVTPRSTQTTGSESYWYDANEYQSVAVHTRGLAEMAHEGRAVSSHPNVKSVYSLFRKTARAVRSVFRY